MKPPPNLHGHPRPYELPGQEYVVANVPRRRRVVAEVLFGVALLLVGILLIVLTFVGDDPRHGMAGRITSLVFGVLLVPLGVGVASPYPRAFRRSWFVFTTTGLQLRTRAGTVFALPWADIAGVSIDAPRNIGRRWARRTTALIIELRPGTAPEYPELRRFVLEGKYSFGFYEYPDLTEAMAGACAMFAGDKYTGVHS